MLCANDDKITFKIHNQSESIQEHSTLDINMTDGDFRLPREISVLQSKRRFPQMLTTQSFEASSQTYS